MGFGDIIMQLLDAIGYLIASILDLLIYIEEKLLVPIFGFIILLGAIYLVIIRPLIKVVTDKENRYSWISILLLVLFGFLGGPLLLTKIHDYIGGTIGLIIGMLAYLAGILLIYYSFKNKESE